MPNPTTHGEAIAGRLLGSFGDAGEAGALAALEALIGDRVYPSKPTQDPGGDYVVYFRTGGGDGSKLGGANGLKSGSFRVEAVGQTSDGAEAILKQVVALLDGWSDRAIGVQGCFAEGDADEATDDDNRQVSGQTFSLWFKAKA